MSDVAAAAVAIREGRLDDAIAAYEAMADRGVVGSSLAFDRGLAYALRARSGRGLAGDLGRSAHAFEEALRRDPHDAGARQALDEVRREIAKRDAQESGKAEELASTPLTRTLVLGLPGDAWAGLALGASLVLAGALALRPRLRAGARLATSTVVVVTTMLLLFASALGVGSSLLRRSLREAVVVSPRATATTEEGTRLELDEGERVDVVEERATTTKVRNDKGEGWAPRDALRLLPPYRP
jgi:hypothetical protein